MVQSGYTYVSDEKELDLFDGFLQVLFVLALLDAVNPECQFVDCLFGLRQQRVIGVTRRCVVQ